MREFDRRGPVRLWWLAYYLLSSTAIFCSEPARAGYWAANTLSNDTALDCLDQIVSGGGAVMIREALGSIPASGITVDQDRIACALAAAELVAATENRPSPNLAKQYQEWAFLHSRDVGRHLGELANKAVELITENAKTEQLLEHEGPEFHKEWLASMNDLRARLVRR